MARSTVTDAVFASDTFGNITAYDLRRGTTLTHYKSGAISAGCLNVLNNDYVLAAEKGPLIYVWPLNSQEKLQTVRMTCSGVVGCCSVSPDALYLAVSVAENLFLYQSCSGRSHSTTKGHYQPITVVKWSPNSSDIVTGGEDGYVYVWKLSDLVSGDDHGINSQKTTNSKSVPHYTFAHHSIKITDLYIGYGELRARLFTASADKTCKIYDLASGNLLLSIVFDVRPTCIIADAPEVRVFVGTFNGHIKTINLLDPPRSVEYHHKETELDSIFSGHTKSITCLAFSVDDTILVSGSADETIKLWHISSRQCIRTIRMKGSVTNVIVRTVPESLQSYELRPTTMVRSFEKRFDESREPQTLEIICPVDEYSEEYVPINEDSNVSTLTQKIEELQRVNRELFNFAKNQILKRKEVDAEKLEGKPVKLIVPPQNNTVKNKNKKFMKKRSNK